MRLARAALIAGVLAPAVAAAAQTCAPPAPAAGLPPEAFAEAQASRPYPTFCSIPPRPTNVPDAATFHREVLGVRIAGARMERQTGEETWSLAGTDDFARVARAQAAPPPPMTTAADTAAFIEAARARATPPPRPR